MSVAQLRVWYEQVQDLPPAARKAWLDAAQLPPELRAELESLLQSPTGGPDPLAALVGRVAAQAASEATPLPERIGPYRVLGVIGEGGMGTVLLAERADGAFQMQVAIKRIRGHAHTRARERFRRERQVLAVLDHPHIAGLIDGGETPDGEPYLVMPYVEGQNLSEWRRAAQPRLEARIELLIALCGAVAHAHQHLVVHRDLKPSNVRVRPDGVPVLLDFGIARLLDSTDAEATGTHLLTPAWASPEHLLGRPLSTATDVYGLGLLLYELLAGGVPERGDVARATSVELPLPSRLAAAAADPHIRGTARRIQGDLDKIVRRAVRIDPAARYPSALALAADLQAWREGRAVQAAGTHLSYLLRRFVQRHRAAVLAVGLALAASVVFAVGLVRERDRAREAEARATREAAVANETTEFLVDLFAELDPAESGDRRLDPATLLAAGRARLERLSDHSSAVRTRLQQTLGSVYGSIGEPQAAIELLEAARTQSTGTTSPPTRHAIGADIGLSRAYYELKQLEAAQAAAQRAVAAAESLPDGAGMLGRALLTLGVAEQSLTRYAEAEALFDRAQQALQAAGDTTQLPSVLHNRAWLAEQRGDPATALTLYEQAHAQKLRDVAPDHPRALTSLHGRGKALAALGRHAEAVTVFEELLQRSLRTHGEATVPTHTATNELASALQDAGRWAEADTHYRRAHELAGRLDGEDGALQALSLNNWGTLLEDRGALAAAEANYRRSRTLRQARMPTGHPGRAAPVHNLARVLYAQGRLDEARAMAEEAHTLRTNALHQTHPARLGTELLLARIAQAQGDPVAGMAQLAALQARIDPAAAWSVRLSLLQGQAEQAARSGAVAARIEARQAAVALGESLWTPEHPRLALLRLDLADALEAGQQSAAASALRAQAAPVLRQSLVASAPALQRLPEP